MKNKKANGEIMLKKVSLFCLILLFISLSIFLLSCSDDSSNKTEPEPTTIIGTWTKLTTIDSVTFTAQVTFKSDSTFEYEAIVNDTIADSVNGTYSVSGDQITFIDNGDDVPGIYNYSINGNELTFSLVSDESEGNRKKVIPGTWIKV